ncbi:MAG: hypothetical protein WC382_12420 [Methanoregulaceae archaeon]|jgi:hypothetical protein
MAKNEKSWKDYGVSETVGFILVFGIMMSGIALVTLYGYPALLDAQENANIRNMERNMISLQSDVNALTYKAVPYKETTMQVSGGVLSVVGPNDAEKWFTVYDNTDFKHLIPSDYSLDNKFSPGNLKFLSDSDIIIISLQNGAVVKRQSDGSVMIAEPRWFIDESTSGGSVVRTLVITLIQIDSNPPGEGMAKSGIANVQMAIKPLIIDIPNDDNILEYGPFDSGHQIRIEYRDIKFDYRTAWENYFKYTLDMEEVVGPPNWEITGINRIIIKAWKINIINI